MIFSMCTAYMSNFIIIYFGRHLWIAIIRKLDLITEIGQIVVSGKQLILLPGIYSEYQMKHLKLKSNISNVNFNIMSISH